MVNYVSLFMFPITVCHRVKQVYLPRQGGDELRTFHQILQLDSVKWDQGKGEFMTLMANQMPDTTSQHSLQVLHQCPTAGTICSPMPLHILA
jgi:hypothetical protein